MNCKTMSLRGVLEQVPSGNIADELIFSYEANDMTRGWKVVDAQIWVRNSKTPAYVGRSRFSVQAQLQTDVIGQTNPGAAEEDLDAADNRAFGWCTASYDTSEGLSSIVAVPVHEQSFLDPDHIITRDFYIRPNFLADSSMEAIRVDICYLIILEEMKLSPAQNILQTVKGIGQSITT